MLWVEDESETIPVTTRGATGIINYSQLPSVCNHIDGVPKMMTLTYARINSPEDINILQNDVHTVNKCMGEWKPFLPSNANISELISRKKKN